MLKFFRIIAFLEGISFIALLVNMLLVKPNFPETYKAILFPLGMTHGMLFLLYIILAIMAYTELKWRLKTLAIVLVASVIPFGTFYIEKKYLTV